MCQVPTRIALLSPTLVVPDALGTTRQDHNEVCWSMPAGSGRRATASGGRCRGLYKACRRNVLKTRYASTRTSGRGPAPAALRLQQVRVGALLRNVSAPLAPERSQRTPNAESGAALCLSFPGKGDHRTPSSGLAQPRHTRPASADDRVGWWVRK
jgi:hypothetical protein